MMTPQDKQTIRQWAEHATLPGKVLLAPADGAETDALAEFGKQLKRLLPAMRIHPGSDEIAFEPPVVVVGSHRNIGFQAVPSGKTLEVFLAVLAEQPPAENSLEHHTAERLRQIDLPVAFTLYIAPQCPHCPVALQQLISLACANRLIRLSIVDAQLFADRSTKDQVKSVPTLVLDDRFRWSGQIDVDEVLTISIQRDPARLSPGSLRQLIEDGQAERVATMMLDSGQIFPALIELLTHERWSVRLGAMVTAEYLAAVSKSLSLALCDRLWHRFPDLADPVRGDVVHVLGEIPSDVNKARLMTIASGAYGDIAKEAAAEVLAEH
jgi:thiol-disulfide isomerase/thioredoxin